MLLMADQKQLFQAPCFLKSKQHDSYKHEDESWMIMEGDHHQVPLSSLSSSSSLEDSSASHGSSSSSSDIVDDASSTNSSSNSNNGPLFELTELMAELPIKRGLSKYYEGKSQSFTSLSRAMSIEELAKKETPYRKKIMKACKSYAGGLDVKATISKKVSRGSFSSLLTCSSGKRGSFLGSNNNNNRLPPIPVQKHF